MDTRKRKRVLKPPLSFPHLNILSIRTLILCFSFILLFVLLSQHFTIGPGRVPPARIVSKAPVLTSSIVSNSVQVPTNGPGPGLGPALRMEESVVLFSDHVLVILSANGKHPRVIQRVDCVYHDTKGRIVIHPMLSAEEYNDDRWIVRCPGLQDNDTVAVGLKWRGSDVAGFDWLVKNMTVVVLPKWDMVTYEATMDGDDVAVVFTKGLNLRSGQVSDPDHFKCHFRYGNNRVWTSPAITAAQEVIRCRLPLDVKSNVGVDEGVQVTVEKIVYLNKRKSKTFHRIMPTIANIYPKRKKNDRVSKKYKLCACTMVWNQAEFIKEWITYHAWLGIERWFIYDNNSDDGLNDIANELDLENYNVSRHVWPWVKSQEAGFAHCVLKARCDCTWIAFFDVDEFYYLAPTKSGQPGPGSLRAVVENVMLAFSTVAEIRTSCLSFGPSGLKKSPERGVTLGYTCRLRTAERHKSIIRPDGVDDTLLNQVHHFRLKKGFTRKTLPSKVAVINHYKYQVWDVFKAKFYRRVSTYVADWQDNQNEHSRDRAPGLGTEAIEPLNWHLRFCKVRDNRLRDFILKNLAEPTTGLLPWEKPATHLNM